MNKELKLLHATYKTNTENSFTTSSYLPPNEQNKSINPQLLRNTSIL